MMVQTAVIDECTSAGEVDSAFAVPTRRELELGAIIDAYNGVTEKLKASHDVLTREVRAMRERLAEKDRELERRQRLAALGEMAAGVAHEVRNPLACILLCANMLGKDLEDQPEKKKLADQIAASSRMLDDIVGDILAFAGPCEPRRRSVVIEELVAEIVGLLGPGITERKCNVSISAAKATHEVFVDPIQVQRALLNVISNAIDAAGPNGHVWIDVRVPRDCDELAEFVELLVSDDGPGVGDGLKDRIFNPFFTTKDSGTGLGLAIVHRVIESHGGSVRVGDREGGGAVFMMTLPAGRTDSQLSTEQL
jgi:signal transduction histidine kinase